MTNRLKPSDTARMYQGVSDTSETYALVAMAIDQLAPRDIRKAAGDRLNDMQKETMDFIASLTDRDMLRAISRCGMIAAVFQAVAKGRLNNLDKPIIQKSDNSQLRLIALLEEQNELLRRMPRNIGVPF